MTILNILIHPDNRLRTKAYDVEIFDNNILFIINNMFETMYFNNGIGLSATQVDIHKKIITINISNNKKNELVLINPKIIKKNGFITSKEGCLSIPNTFLYITRYRIIKVKAFNKYGEEIIINAKNLLSICIQHEIDHLFGILFIDYLSSKKY